MEKALGILKEIEKLSGLPSDEELSGAIKELEEAMKPKTCEGCKQSWEPNNQTFHKYFCEYLQRPVHSNFYCNRYEPKKRDGKDEN